MTTTTYRSTTPEAFSAVSASTAILVDFFPATAIIPSPDPDPDPELPKTLSPVRLIITANPDTTLPDRIHIFSDSSAGPALVYSAPTDPDSRTGNNHTGTITVPDGTLSYTKAGGCGCGSALKSFQPFTHPYSVA